MGVPLIPDPAARPLLLLGYDGVVADSFEVLAAAFVQACAQAGIEEVRTPDDVLALFEGNVFERLRALGADDAAVGVVRRVTALTVRTSLPWLRPFPLMPQVLNELGDAHRVVLVTSSDDDVVRTFLRRYRVTGVSEVRGAQAGESKIGKIASLIAAAPPQEAVWFVGDTIGDIREALLAGARPCAVAWGWHAPELLVEAGAVAVAETPAQLVEIVAPGQADDFWD